MYEGQSGIPYAGGLGDKPAASPSWLSKLTSGMGGMSGALGALGGGILGGILGEDSGPDPMDYLSQISSQVDPYLSPYMKAGKGALGDLGEQYGGLLSDPAAMLNKIGMGYKQSPGLNFAIQQAMQGSNRAAAAGGMAGSPMAQQLSQEKATGLAQQDYYNWLNQAKGMYGAGLSGMQGLAGMGLGAGTDMAQAIAQALSAQAQAAQEQQAAGAQQGGGIGGILGDITGGALHAFGL